MTTYLPCRCGGDGRVVETGKHDSTVDRALGQLRRIRRCIACGARWQTTELPTSDLQALRQAAHALLMADVRLRQEREATNAFQRGLNEALNFGDGSYRP